MWTESEQAGLARIDEADRMAATAAARRYLTGPQKTMLEPDDDYWQYAAAVGLGVWLYRRRPMAPAVVTGHLNRVVTGLSSEAWAASAARDVPLEEWALRLAGISMTAALVAGAFAVGGWARLDVARADIEEHLASEIRYLDRFADDAAAGKVLRDGRFARRAVLYGAAGWGLYMLLRGREARRRGYDEESSVLDPGAEHCQECVGEAGKGWRPLGELTPVGSRQCRSNCRCRMQYRNAAGEIVE